jgi:toxin HigB-1
MEVRYEDDDLRRLEVDKRFAAGLSSAIVSAFRRRMQQVRAATDERDLFALRSLNFEKLKGKRHGEHSLRLNQQFRLICRLEGRGSSKVIVIDAIEDYH